MNSNNSKLFTGVKILAHPVIPVIPVLVFCTYNFHQQKTNYALSVDVLDSSYDHLIRLNYGNKTSVNERFMHVAADWKLAARHYRIAPLHTSWRLSNSVNYANQSSHQKLWQDSRQISCLNNEGEIARLFINQKCEKWERYIPNPNL